MLHVAIALAIADFRVNEVVPQVGGDPEIRFVELFVPVPSAGNCLFPTTRIEVFDADGTLLGAEAPFVGTVCFPQGTYFLLATDKAAQRFGVTRDAKLDIPIPPFAGQVCLASSATRYDCARWGPIGDPVLYLRNTDDVSSGPSIPDGSALARTGDQGVVSSDFILQEPTPRQPNDGSVWMGPDAGPAPDAMIVFDAGVPDARIFVRPDAAVVPGRDASLHDPPFLSADPGGGVMCGCRVGGGGAPRGGWCLAALALLALRRRRRA